MVDEDPGISNHPYEKNLRVVQEKNGLKLYTDSKGNKVIELKEKLENWILTVCANSNIDPRKYSLPSNPKKLHDEINYKLDKFENLIEELLRVNNPAILQLKSWLR